MKCPLFLATHTIQSEAMRNSQAECLKEECAWWQKEIGNCIVYQMGMELGTLCFFLEDIKKKLPTPPTIKK